MATRDKLTACDSADEAERPTGRRTFKRTRGIPWAAAAALLLVGCADREEVAKSAMRVAEANYPGQLEILDVRLTDQFRHRVTFGIKGDPITRFSLSLGSDPAECLAGSECEARLRKAYTQGVLASSRLKTLNRAFRTCGVPLLAPDGMSEAFYLELYMERSNPQPALDRLQSCTARYWQESRDKRPLHFRILRPRKEGPAARPQLVTFESKLPAARYAEPSYLITARAGEDRIPQAALRFDPRYLRTPPVRDKLKAVILEHLGQQRSGATLPDYMTFEGTRLDAQRIDLVHTLVPACSQPPAQRASRCIQDVAAHLTYDLGTGEMSVIKVVARPTLKGRGFPETLSRGPAAY
jgi:hypothetical protein